MLIPVFHPDPKCRRLHIKRQRHRIERRYCCIEWRVFHDVSQCFKSVSWFFMMKHNVLHVFHYVLLCLTMRVMQRSASPAARSVISLTGTELLQSPFRTEFSMWSLSRRYRRSLQRRYRPADFCGVIADFCGVIADPCGVGAIADRCATR